MSELFEDESEEIEVVEEYAEAAVEPEVAKTVRSSLDARRKLERMLEEKRLRDELNDFIDY